MSGWPIGDYCYTRPRDGLTHDVTQWYDDDPGEVRLRCGLSPNDEPDLVRVPTTCLRCLAART